METLETLRDIANGKPRRFFRLSSKAAERFKEWIAGWQAAQSLAEVLDEWDMSSALDEHLSVRTRLQGTRLLYDVRPRAPWDNNRSGPYPPNDELLYLVLSLVTMPKCDRLRLCVRCKACFIAVRRPQKYCSGKCGRLAAAKRIVDMSYAKMREKRIEKCREAYTKYRELNPKPRVPAAQYVLAEANRRLPRAYHLGGTKAQVNFITLHAEAIGIVKGEN